MEVEEAEQVLLDNEAAIEAIAPAMTRRKITFAWVIGYDPAGDPITIRSEYIQAPLGLFPAQEFQTMLTRIAKDTLQGKYGVNVGQLLSRGGQIRASMPSEINEESINDLIGGENIKVIEAFLELIELVPELLKDCIALSLGVRSDKREEFKQCISAPTHEGGLTIDQGVDIIKVFIRQNGGPIKRFLESQIKEIGEEIARAIEDPKAAQKRAATDGGTQSSTTSVPTQEPV
jgi:hypothetical protein